jgi:hypothetical protein
MAVPLIVASAVIGAAGAIRSAQAQSAASNYNAQVATQNASIAESQGNAAAEAQQRDAQRRLGSTLAAFGASGVQTDTGSPVDVLTDSARQATLDNLTTRYNYKRGLGYTTQAQLDSASASNATTAGYLSAAGSLVGGASKAYGMSQGGGGSAIPTFGG